jgi:hypothetical protein
MHMKKAFSVGVLTALLGVGISVVASRTAGAAPGPDNRCFGEIAAGIASTWPWAHNDKEAFPPPPGAIHLWIQEFGPEVGISSVRQLQLLFCSE